MQGAFGRTLSLALPLFVAAACVDELRVGQLASPGSSTGPSLSDAGAQEPAVDSGDAALGFECTPSVCRGRALACGDCIDNDEDGRIDAADPDCFGPCDDSETTLAGRANPCPAEACFFDVDCGVGNDQACLELVPNGCDCFGCCDVGLQSAVFLGSVGDNGEPSCSSAVFDDPAACAPCQLDPECFNSCEPCELCFGRSEVDRSSCNDGAGCLVPECTASDLSCSSACGVSCPESLSCVTGCCVSAEE